MDPTQQAAALAAAAASAAVQQMAATMQPTLLAATQRTTNLPGFWPHDPHSWFQMAEAEFAAARYELGSHACYAAVLRALSTEAHQRVQDVTARLTPEVPDAYIQLRDALLDRFTLSPLQSSYLLLEHPPMGARTPLALFTDMQRLVPPQADTLLNALFLQRLPDRLRDALADRGHLAPKDLAAAAHTIYSSYPAAVVAALATESPRITTITTGSPAPPLGVAAVAGRGPTRGRRLSKSPARRSTTPRRRGRDSRSHSPSSDICWYHANFGSRAQRCAPPCRWQGNE
jgi:hypothetical protein